MIWHLNINKREKIFLCAGAALVFLTIFYAAVVSYKGLMAGFDRKIALRQKYIKEMTSLKGDIFLLQERITEAEKKVSLSLNFSLFSFMEQKVQESAGRENLVFMRPKPTAQRGDFEEISLEVKLEKINLEQVTRLIYEIEAADVPLHINTLQIRSRKPNTALLDVTMDISTLRKK